MKKQKIEDFEEGFKPIVDEPERPRINRYYVTMVVVAVIIIVWTLINATH
jgi:hypothetical protein